MLRICDGCGLSEKSVTLADYDAGDGGAIDLCAWCREAYEAGERTRGALAERGEA